jgi:N utilization substance protein B
VNQARRRAREAALQVLYFWEVGRVSPQAALDAYFAEHQPDATQESIDFTASIVEGVVDDQIEVDQLIGAHSQHWRLDRLAIVDRLILRMAVWELRESRETDPAVVINEAIELARRFSGDESARFVNGVLDAIRKAVGR